MKKFFLSNSLLLVALTFVTPVGAEISWSEPEIVHQGAYQDRPNISLNECNQAIVIWCERNDLNEEQVKTRLYSNGWQPAINCSVLAKLYLEGATVALNSKGHAVATWQRYGSVNSTLRVANYSDGVWGKSKSQLLIPDGQGNMVNLEIALNDAEEAVAICTTQTKQKDFLRASVYENGAWQAIQTVSSNSSLAGDEKQVIRNAKVALNDVGDMVIVWDLFDGSQTMIKALHRNRDSRTWSEPVVISQVLGMETGIISLPQVALNNSGEAIVVWTGNGEHSFVGSSTFSAGAWSEPNIVNSEFVGGSVFPSVALNNHGNALITWQSNDLLYAMRKYNGTWGLPTPISQAGWNCQTHKIVLNDADAAVVIYNASEKINSPEPFPPAPPIAGFVATFSGEKWEAPQQMFSLVLDVGLNQQGKVFVLGASDDSIQARCSNF